VIREAFSAGNPVVATRVGGHVELLAQGAGFLYEPDAQGELDYALERLTTEPGLGRSLVEEQPRVATMAEHATEIAEIFRSIANETEFD
jgi:glycosyltransferase involved in cell wall biosynthesis